jgi:Na+/proline symporter
MAIISPQVAWPYTVASILEDFCFSLGLQAESQIMITIDWVVVLVYALLALAIGVYFTHRAGKNIESYFVGGRSLPWWAIGFSTVATFTSAGSASAFTMLVYTGGLLGNWWWWIPWMIWMPLVAVIWSKFWRRLGIVSTAEFVEVRYGGRASGIFRSVAAIYFSLGWAVVLIAYVTGWITKSVGPSLGWSNMAVILFAAAVTLFYTLLGGLLGAVYSEVFQFAFFVLANVIFIPVVIRRLGGLGNVYQSVEKIAGAQFFRATPPGGAFTGLTIFALVLQGLFFAASPAGGEGFTAQKFMSARNEFHAQVGQLFNAFLSLVVRVIPFFFLGILGVAAFPHSRVAGERVWGDLVKLFGPPGLKGLLIAGEFAAYQSAVSTELNWGASYLVNDLYKRQINPGASERHYVWAGRMATFGLLVIALMVAGFFVKGMMAWFLFINNVMIAFILPLSWLRFFWWRLNIWGEIAALAGGLPLSYIVWFVFDFAHKPFWEGFLLLFGAGWVVIVAVTLATAPEKRETLMEFYLRCRPPGFWGEIAKSISPEEHRRLRAETWSDIYECALGIAFCTGVVVMTAELFGRHWAVASSWGLVTAVTFGLFCSRWSGKGIFKQLRSDDFPKPDDFSPYD